MGGNRNVSLREREQLTTRTNLNSFEEFHGKKEILTEDLNLTFKKKLEYMEGEDSPSQKT